MKRFLIAICFGICVSLLTTLIILLGFFIAWEKPVFVEPMMVLIRGMFCVGLVIGLISE